MGGLYRALRRQRRCLDDDSDVILAKIEAQNPDKFLRTNSLEILEGVMLVVIATTIVDAVVIG